MSNSEAQFDPKSDPKFDPKSDKREDELVDTWQKVVQCLFGLLALVGALAMARYYALAQPQSHELEQQVHQLSLQVEDLEREQSVSAVAVDNARESVAYIYGIYHVSGSLHSFRARV